jgi:hypothetical protein
MRMKLIALLAFTGLLAAALSATWGPEERITSNRLDNVTHYTNGHKLVYGSGGVGHCVWYDEDGPAVYYKRFYPDKGWSKELQLCKQSSTPSVALDADGSTIHVVWSARKRVGHVNYYHIFYQKCTPGSSGNDGWDPEPTDLCEIAPAHYCYNPSIACGPDGQVVATWEERWESPGWVYSIGFREYAAGGWQEAGLIAGPDPFTRYTPSIATDPDGNVFVAYYGAESPDGRIGTYVWADRRLGGTWQGWECVTAKPDAAGFLLGNCAMPDIDVDPTTGYPHVVCHGHQLLDGTESYKIYHSCSTGDGWEPPEQVYGGVIVGGDRTPSLSFGSDGSAHVVWSQETPAHGVNYSVLAPGASGWSWPVPITTGFCPCYSPSITVGADGSLHAVWTRYDAGAKYPYQLYGSSAPGSFAAGGQAGRPGASAPGFALDVSPNPASRGARVSYSLPVAGNFSLKLYDVSGSLTQTLASGYAMPGRHTAGLSGLSLGHRVYLLKLETGSGSLTRKLVAE